MKTALHTVSYMGVWPGQAALSLEDTVRKAARLGFDGIMLAGKRPHGSPLDLEGRARKRLGKVLSDAGIGLLCVAGYTDFCAQADAPGIPLRQAQVLAVTELSRLARDLGCGLVRVFTGYERRGASFDQQWDWCVAGLRECARRAADLGVTIGVQNHHDIAADHASMRDLLADVGEPNCRAMFDAWSPALHGTDIVAAAREMAPWTVQTTVADYVKRPRFSYRARYVNYERALEAARAVPMGEGFIDYPGFFAALREGGFDGTVAYEMCSPMRGGGSEENLDRCAARFVEFLKGWKP